LVVGIGIALLGAVFLRHSRQRQPQSLFLALEANLEGRLYAVGIEPALVNEGAWPRLVPMLCTEPDRIEHAARRIAQLRFQLTPDGRGLRLQVFQ
jgi:hypothetical protein